MILETYGKSQRRKKSVAHGRASNLRTVSVNRRYGTFCFSVNILKDENVVPEQTVHIAQDLENKKWYLRFSDKDDGLRLRILNRHKEKRGHSPTYTFACKIAALKLLNELNAENSATLLVGKSLKKMGDYKWFPIMTKSPLKMN